MADFAGDGGMIPEQVWDVIDVPEKRLSFGRATGSASPLAWAHAEYLKLLRSLAEGSVFDRPPQTVERYLAATRSDRVTGLPEHRRCRIAPGEAPRRDSGTGNRALVVRPKQRRTRRLTP